MMPQMMPGQQPRPQGRGMAPNMGMPPQMGQPGMMPFPGMQMAQPAQPRKDKISLHVGNLSDNVYDTELYQFFKNNGYSISSAKVVFNKETKQHAGFGYINFFTQDEADRCLDSMNNVKLGNKQIMLSKIRSKDNAVPSDANLIVRNLPKEVDQAELMNLFKQFGKVVSCKLEVDRNGESKGYGYVQFEKTQEAQAAIQAMNDKEIGKDQKKKISVFVH